MSDEKPTRQNRVVVRWDGDHRFDGSRLGSERVIRMDADAVTGPGPVDTLLCALAACTGVEGLTIEVIGDRAGGTPAKLTRIVLAYRIRGTAVERPHAERAIELAVTKYCSVRDSLDPSMPVEWTLEIE